ncbi:Protein CBG12166 [Caenorhabditis briggsae]|uniref:Protein CBG12166 n=1 Tax=Caenorhabditis briggsae TaxID=6238 RepID=A8XEW8_CAEBR|nr:Protein CBG12166 [Caenorhabditis briggsae]CAP31190.2 Protein CBG12166 [Caenorhabditis briggsae]
METEKMSSGSRKKKTGAKPSESGSKVKQQKNAQLQQKKKEAVTNTKVIRLLGNRSVYHVPVEDFVRVSQLVKQQQTSGKLMATVDLHRFSDQSIIAFVNFVQNREIKSALTYYAITELVTLAHTFQMKELKLCLEDCMIEASKSSEADLLQTMIICDVAHVNPDTERLLQNLAIETIEKLVTLPDFYKMPFHQLFQVLSSCDLTITHEMFVADVVLLWLSGQNHVNAFAPSLLSCIRTKFLSPVDRTIIIERLNQLNMLISWSVWQQKCSTHRTANVSVWIRIILRRTCLGSKCGANVNPAPFNAHSSLPLSRPTFNMKMKKSKEPKAKPTFDPSTAPRVIDLINSDPKVVKIEQSVEKKEMKKKQKEANKAKKSESKRTRKSRCACIDYVKSKMSKKKYKKGPGGLKDPNAVKVKPPGNSISSKKSDVSSKTSMTSKMSSSTKTNPNASGLEKSLEKRRAHKRGKIQEAIKTSKSNTSVANSSKSKSSTGNKSLASSNKSTRKIITF